MALIFNYYPILFLEKQGPKRGFSTGRNANYPQIVSGQDGSTLLACNSAKTDSFGLHEFVDVDEDGRKDYITVDQNYNSVRGRAVIISGANCNALYSITGENPDDRLMLHSIVSDANADGVKDFIMYSYGFGNSRGKYYLYSGGDGALINSLEGSFEGARFGLRGLSEDLDGDGKKEFIFSEKKDLNSDLGRLKIYNYDFSDVVLNFENQCSSQYIVKHDFNKDGVIDIICSHSIYDNNKGLVAVYSGVDGSLLSSLEGQSEGDKFGQYIFIEDNRRTDGQFEILISGPNYGRDGDGKVYILPYPLKFN